MALSRKEKNQIISALATLRAERTGPLVGRHFAFQTDLDDRTIAPLVFNNIEQALEDAIATFFVGDVSKLVNRILIGGQSEAVINTFYAKTWVAHALGVFGPLTLEDLNTIRAIRNAFAHTALPVSFDMSAIKAACVFSVIERLPAESEIRKRMPLSPRDLYAEVGTLFCGMISSIANLSPSQQFTQDQVDRIKGSFRQILV